MRILRVARFAARFADFEVAPETLALMREMVEAGEADALVPERVWQELALKFDAGILRKGGNEMTLTVPAGDVTTGVVYDYLRLELKED